MAMSATQNRQLRALRGLLASALLALPLLALSTPAARAASPLTPEAVERASDQAADQWLEKGIAGFSVAILQDGKLVLEKSYGKGYIELDTATPRDAVYEIASDAKPFTAAAILRLAGEGRLALDDPLAKHLPDALPIQVGQRITLRQMLTHTSGVPEFTVVPAFDALASQNVQPEAVLALVRDQPLAFEPGAAQAYSNTGYLLLAMLVKKLTGQAWGDYIEREIFAPLGMRGSRASLNQEIVPGLVMPYELNEGKLVRAPYHAYELIHGNAGLRSTARDMATWVNALHTGKVLDRALYREMTTPGRLADGTPLRYGLGLVVADRVAGHRAYFHGGTFPGYMSYSAYLPEQRIAIAVLTNTTGPFSEDAIASDILVRLIGDARTPVKPHPLPLAEYVGEYVANVRSRRTMQVTLKDGRLFAIVEPWDTGPREFVPIAPDRFTSDWIDLRFLRRDGRIVGVVRSSQVSVVAFERK